MMRDSADPVERLRYDRGGRLPRRPSEGTLKRSRTRLLTLAALLVLGLLAQRAGLDPAALGLTAGDRVPAASDASTAHAEATRRIERAFAARESGFMITLEGRVAKTLADDRDGSRHQRFLLELESGRTLLVAHNIDLAERIPLARDDRVRLRGQYEWNERGGVIHWTHHDPDGRHEGGWIESGGRRTE